MNRTLLTLATASIFALGCGSAALEQAAPTTPTAPAAEQVAATPAKADTTATDDAQKPAGAAPAITGALASRKVGDFVVYRFTGSFRKTPLTLTEKVVAKKGTILTIDIAADEANKREELRVKVDEATGAREVLSVAKLEGGLEKPATMAAYEALMARTTLAADENEAALGTDEITIDVGGAQLACKRSSFRVRVGKNRGATLKTIESDAFAWGDVGGEITAQNGKTLYRAEVIEVGHADAKPAVAISDFDDE